MTAEHGIFCRCFNPLPAIYDLLYALSLLLLYFGGLLDCKQYAPKQEHSQRLYHVEAHQNKRYEPVHEISNNVVCAASKVSDQPAHTGSLIRAFANRLSIL